MVKNRGLKRAIELLVSNGQELAERKLSDHEGLIRINEVLLTLLKEDSK